MSTEQTPKISYKSESSQLEWTQFELELTGNALKQMEHFATTDRLTGLLNKEAWKKEVEARMAQGKSFGVIFMDMNEFKLVNDSQGHETGDTLLAAFGNHLQTRLKRKNDRLTHEKLVNINGGDDMDPAAGRYGGDEFGIVVGLDENDKREGDPAQQLAKAVDYVREVTTEFTSGEDVKAYVKDYGFGFAIGGDSWQPGDPRTSSELIKAADESMYRDKQAQKLA